MEPDSDDPRDPEQYDYEEGQERYDQEPQEGEGYDPQEGRQENYQEEDSESEDDFPEFANDQNKKLNQLVREKKRTINKLVKEYQKDYERKKILQEHLRNVEQQILHTKGLIDVKNKQTQTENHMWQVTQRQSGRLQSQIKKNSKIIQENQQRLNDIHVRILTTNGKIQNSKVQLNWNQQELEQWAVTGKQKQEDNVTLQKYQKQDNAKIRQLNLQIQKLTIEVGRKQSQLQKQITSTQASQIQLDKTAEEFKKQHDERHRLFTKWQQITQTIARRDNNINQIGQDYVNLKQIISSNQQILSQRKKNLQNQKKINDEQQARNVLGNRQISDKKNDNKKLQFERIANLQAEVQILKNQLSSFSTDLAKKRNLVNSRNQDLLAKKQRLQNQQAKFKAFQTKLNHEYKLSQKFGEASKNAQAYFKDKQQQKKKIQQQISLQKDNLVRSSQQLFKLRQQQASLYGQIQGIIAACRNLKAHINKLNQQFQKQQQLLYNAQYQIQLMERKVARARGQRTLEQKKDLQKDVDQASKKNKQVRDQHKILNESVKRLNQDLRTVENKLNQVKGSQKRLSSNIQQLSLQNDMTIQDLSKITKKKQEVLVQHDIMKLQIKKIKESLHKATDHVYSLQNKKNQLQMTMQERQKQIQVHRDVLLAEHKAIEDQRHKIAIELAQRKTKVKNLRIKYQSLVQKAHGSSSGQAEHSQAYYVIKASQQRQQLQRKGDQWSAKIIKAQKQLKSLYNTRDALVKRCQTKKVSLMNKGVTKGDLDQKQALEQQCNAASQNLFKKKNQLNRLAQQYEQDLKRLSQTQNKSHNLNERKVKLEQVLHTLTKQLKSNDEKIDRALKSLDLGKKNAQKKKIELTEDNPHIVQLQYDIQNDKQKTLVTALMNLGNDLPQLGPLIEQVLKQNQVDLPSRAPSQISMMSSKGSMSIKSGGSALSRSSGRR